MTEVYFVFILFCLFCLLKFPFKEYLIASLVTLFETFWMKKDVFDYKPVISNLVKEPNQANTTSWPLVLKAIDRCNHVIGCWIVFFVRMKSVFEIRACFLHSLWKNPRTWNCPLPPKQVFNLLLYHDFLPLKMRDERTD